MQSDLNCLLNQSYHVSGNHVCNKYVCHGTLESGLGSSISSMDIHWTNSGNNCSSVTSNDSEPASVLINTCHTKYDCHDLTPVSEEEDCDCMMGLWNKVEESNIHLNQLPWRDVDDNLGEDLLINYLDIPENRLQLSNDFSRYSRENTLVLGHLSLSEDLYNTSQDNVDKCINLYHIPHDRPADMDHSVPPNDSFILPRKYSHQCEDLCTISRQEIGECNDTCTYDNNNESLTFFNPECDHLICSTHHYPWLINDVQPLDTTDDSIAHLEYPWTNDTFSYPVLSPMCHDIHNSIRKSDICHNHISCKNNNHDIFYRRQSLQNSSCNMRSINVYESRANIFDGDNNEDQVQVRAAERVVEWLKLVTTP